MSRVRGENPASSHAFIDRMFVAFCFSQISLMRAGGAGATLVLQRACPERPG